MSLEIKFIEVHAKSFNGGGIHLVIDDGCTVDLNKSLALSSIQMRTLNGYGDEPVRAQHLLYFNTIVIDDLIKHGSIVVHCPNCNRDYEITPEDYHSAFQKFRDSKTE